MSINKIKKQLAIDIDKFVRTKKAVEGQLPTLTCLAKKFGHVSKFALTGKLPQERDVRRASAYHGWDDNAGAYYIEPGPDRDLDLYGQAVHMDQHIEKEPIMSEEAEIFAERRKEFESTLSRTEQSVFSLNIIGQMTRKEVALILGVSQQRVGEILGIIRKKAGRFTKEKLQPYR